MSTTHRQKDNVLSRNEIEALIAEGKKIVILEGRVLKVDAWLPYHPGGHKAILHMVGRDATNEIHAFHAKETREVMPRYQIGRIEGRWKDFVPLIQGGKFRSRDEQEQEQQHTRVSVEDEHSSASSDQDSDEPSPIFEASEPKDPSMRRRRHRKASNAASDSSATSLSTLALEDSTTAKRAQSPSSSEELTNKAIQHDLSQFPSLDPSTQQTIITKYRALDDRFHAEGFYSCNYTAYAWESLRYLSLALASYLLLRNSHFLLSSIFLGLLWHQLVFTVHDAGHMGITQHFQTDAVIGMLIADWIGGLSVCWWKRNHNVHHIVTNSAEHDPDIQHMPFFAISHRFVLDDLFSTYYDRGMPFDWLARRTLPHQHLLYYPILAFGRFNLYVLSWTYILLGQGPRKGPAAWHRWFELAGQIFFWYWFGYLVVYRGIPTAGARVMYVLVSHAVTMPVHVQITLSHFGMSTADLGVGESFPQRMLRTTMDVDCPAWLDFLHGGLQFQAVHHLYPRIPRHNLRAAQKYVREFCEEVGIPYAIYGFAEGNGKVIGRLGEIAKQARMWDECRRGMTAKDALEGH